MSKNYFLVALRNLTRRKGYAFINIFGMATGMAACLLISLYVRHELSYDTFHVKAQRLYRVDDVPERFAPFTEIETGPMLKSAIPEIEQTVRLSPLRSSIRHGDKILSDANGMYAENNFFDLFSFDLLAGNPSALRRPGTVVLTRPLARKLFGGAEAIGQIIGQPVSVKVRGRATTLDVAGVTAAVPSNSHLTFDFLLSLETLRAALSKRDFNAHELWTYVLLEEGADPEALQASVQKVASNIPAPPRYRLLLHPITNLYLYHWAPRQGDPRYLYFFSTVAGIILLIAGVNYMTLATARATRRAREVGVRKVVGARREQIAGQFLGESMLVSLLALPVALALLALALPFFNATVGTDLAPILSRDISTLLLLVGLAVLVGLAAGAYPALFLSRFRPAEVLRERLPSGWTGARLRKSLTVFQFTLSATLLFSTAVIVQQLRYVQHKNLGFDEERVAVLPLNSEALAKQAPALKQELARLPQVEQVALASSLPGMKGLSGSTFEWAGKKISLKKLIVDPDFIETLNLNLIAGRSLAATRPADSSAYVLNESAAHALGWTAPQAAVGEQISFFGKTWRIVGVVENFHYESLRDEITPLALQLAPFKRVVAVRLAAGSVPPTLKKIEKTWAQFTDVPFAYTFLDERIDQLYAQEQQTARVLGGFAGLALLLACLGLFALATYAVERRTKEISIRKVMGASAGSIVALLSKDFLKLLALALALAAPLAYVGTRRWLEGFAYHISPSPLLFLGVGVAVLLVAFVAVGSQALRAARANPAEHLRSE